MSGLERRIVDLPRGGGRRYCVIGPRMAVDFHVEGADGFDPIAGLECHYRQRPSYQEGREPFSEKCWLTGERCWGDGTSMYATEWLLPLFDPDDLDSFWTVLEREHDKRDRDAFGEPEKRVLDASVSGGSSSMPPQDS